MTIDLDALEAMDSIVPKRTKALFDGIKARRNARGFHMPQDIDDAEEHASKLERELSFAQEQIAALREQYDDLIMQVASKYPGETRHQTAKRYIAQSEIPMPNAALAASRKSNG